jgi:enoyl-CoA hydratase/carnithine racemase
LIDTEPTGPESTGPDPTGAGPEVLVGTEGAVRLLTLNRPRVLNAITPSMADAYADALRAADDDPRVRAIVVTGAGRGFCSGADTSRLAAGGDAVRSGLTSRDNLPTLAFRIRKPVIAAVNGPVAGIGFAYMMASDIRFTADDARISTTFARLGLVAEYGLSWLLPRVVGAGWALDLLLSGRTITGAEAVEIGLAQYTRATETLLDDALGYAAMLAENCSPASMAAAKGQVYGDLDGSREDALTRALGLMEDSFAEPDFTEAFAARAAKRAPGFAPLPGRADPPRDVA